MVIYCDAGVRKNERDLIEKLVENKVKFAKTLTKRVTHFVIDDGWREIEEHKKAKKRKQERTLEIVYKNFLFQAIYKKGNKMQTAHREHGG